MIIIMIEDKIRDISIGLKFKPFKLYSFIKKINNYVYYFVLIDKCTYIDNNKFILLIMIKILTK